MQNRKRLNQIKARKRLALALSKAIEENKEYKLEKLIAQIERLDKKLEESPDGSPA